MTPGLALPCRVPTQKPTDAPRRGTAGLRRPPGDNRVSGRVQATCVTNSAREADPEGSLPGARTGPRRHRAVQGNAVLRFCKSEICVVKHEGKDGSFRKRGQIPGRRPVTRASR